MTWKPLPVTAVRTRRTASPASSSASWVLAPHTIPARGRENAVSRRSPDGPGPAPGGPEPKPIPRDPPDQQAAGARAVYRDPADLLGGLDASVFADRESSTETAFPRS